MCVTVFFEGINREAANIGELRAIVGNVVILPDYEPWGDDWCLCPVDIHASVPGAVFDGVDWVAP